MHALLALTLALLPSAAQEASPAVDFERDVRPLLASRCVECHGAKKHKGGLRLDRRRDALAGAQFGAEPVIVPGDALASRLYQRVVSEVEDERMPATGEPLSPGEIAVLRAWIDAGASWPADADEREAAAEHWAYRAPRRPALPTELRESAWVRNPIDAFLLARWEREGWVHAPEAPPERLLRRVSLDLTGLPPTVEELDQFLADPAPDAYERAVERLLASPRYGEHMAVQWLDLARYADTNGYEKDDRRSQWRWRDWVIEAFNRDLPYDRFTLEQLAGDLLPDAGLEQRVATGFHRNTLINEEGGTDPEEFRAAALVDRVNTTASVWLASTLACAQCHNHKYDPFTARDYYRFLAYFDRTTDTGNARAPELLAPTGAQRERVLSLRAEREALLARLEGPDEPLEQAQEAWIASACGELPPPATWRRAAPLSWSARSGVRFVREADDSLLAAAADAADVLDLVLAPGPGEVSALRLVLLRDGRLPAQGPGRAANGNAVVTEVELFRLDSPASAPERVPIASAEADHEQGAQGEFRAAAAIDGRPDTGWAAGSFERPGDRELVLLLPAAIACDAQTLLELRVRQEWPGGGHALGRVAVEVGNARAGPFPRAVVEALRTPEAERTQAERATLRAHFRRRVDPEGRARADRLARVESDLAAAEAAFPKVMVMQERVAPRETRVYTRGDFRNPGERVEPGTPAVLPELPGAPRDRLGLARWLVDPAHPLVARVAVNRAWERCFGVGIVPTSDDFGTRGEPPTYPELLDWLALEFVARGWSQKELLRLIVTSAAYRQDSRVTAGSFEADPENRRFLRGPRGRVQAETVRDLALAISGLLVEKVGGPSVFPPQPAGIWNLPYNGDRWIDDPGEDRYRRGLYVFARRSAPYPTFNTFDAPTRELACTRRPRSNSPLQALTLLNDPAFVECAGGFARRILVRAGDEVSRARWAFRAATGRTPEAGELEVVLGLFAGERARFERAPQAAARLAAASRVEGVAPTPELAAWIVVANALLNLDETITKS